MEADEMDNDDKGDWKSDNKEDWEREAELVYARGLAGLPADGKARTDMKGEQDKITKYIGRDLADLQDGLHKRKTMPPSQKFLGVEK
jgi:hypothetical protein